MRVSRVTLPGVELAGFHVLTRGASYFVPTLAATAHRRDAPMPRPICLTCGTQFPDLAAAPAECPTCTDERQFVPAAGQRWTSLEALRAGHRNAFQRLEPGLYAVGTVPDFGIAQRALLVRTPHGNVLWDCISLIDDATVDIVRGLGGLSAIAISHPHFFSSMVEWAHAFDCPVVLHAAHREHVVRPDAAIEHWEGDRRELLPGLTLLRLGGHFAGSTVLHWAGGAGGAGALLAGDTIQVVQDARWVSFMRSYPNLIPLPAVAVERIVAGVAPYAFERIYSPWPDRHILTDAKGAVMRSAARYAAALANTVDA